VDLSLVVVSFNVCADLAECLASVEAGGAGLSCETIVVDNASADGTPEMLRSRFPAVTVVRNLRNLGFAAAVNQGLQGARGRYLLLLNPDSLLERDSLRRLVAFMDSRADCGASTGRVYLDPGRTWLASNTEELCLGRELGVAAGRLGARLLSRRSLERIWRVRWEAWLTRMPLEVPSIQGNFLLVRRGLVERVGGMDPGFFLYYEDADWCHRIRAAGWKLCLDPRVGVIHTHNQSAKRLGESLGALLRESRRRYLRKHYGWAASLGVRGIARLDGVRSHLTGDGGWSGEAENMGVAADGGGTVRLRWPRQEGADRYLVEVSIAPPFLGAAGRIVEQSELAFDAAPFHRIGLREVCWRAVPFGGDLPIRSGPAGMEGERVGGWIRLQGADRSDEAGV
jgi:N-acetylglucosaminyl-diphospho-decaprenol L-rhamnosyltransferase